MLIRVNEIMDKLLKDLERKNITSNEIAVTSILITDEVYKQWKDKEDGRNN